MKLRSELQWFAQLMEKKLRVCDHKKHWRFTSHGMLEHQLDNEIMELKTSMHPEEIVSEAVDVANLAMMIADKNQKIAKITQRDMYQSTIEFWVTQTIENTLIKYIPDLPQATAKIAAQRVLHVLREPCYRFFVERVFQLTHSSF